MDLEDVRDKLHLKAQKHKKNETGWQSLYYLLGSTSTILLLIASISNGLNKFDMNFYLTGIAALLNSMIAFFKINSKTSLHHSFASDCKELEYSIISYLESIHTNDQDLLFKKNVINQQKRQYDREPPILPCFNNCY